MPHYISPSILSANFGNLSHDIELLNKSQADYIHIDVMDGIFVPNISIGFPVIKYINSISSKPLDVHLMIEKPERYIEQFVNFGAKILTVHYEACTHLHRTIQEIKSFGIKAGVSINPHTPVKLLCEIICDVDIVLIMSVNPGFGGQKFILNSISKIEKLKQLIINTKSKALIEVDGGVDLSNYKQIVKAGADILVAGNAIFASDNILGTISKLKV